jgi:hypothetical protein
MLEIQTIWVFLRPYVESFRSNLESLIPPPQYSSLFPEIDLFKSSGSYFHTYLKIDFIYLYMGSIGL